MASFTGHAPVEIGDYGVVRIPYQQYCTVVFARIVFVVSFDGDYGAVVLSFGWKTRPYSAPRIDRSRVKPCKQNIQVLLSDSVWILF